jgi:hypothetical protein
MTITPTLDAKLLGEMVPGELIRFPAGRAMVLGIVAGCDHLGIASGLVIVLLGDLPDRPGVAGQFLPISEFMMSKTGLSYGREHIVVVHPSAPVAEPSDERFATDGALLVAPGARALRTSRVIDAFSDVVLTIDIETWKAVRSAPPHPSPWRVAVLAWEIRLVTGVSINPPLSPVFTFRTGG